MIVARNTLAIWVGGDKSAWFDALPDGSFTPRYRSTPSLVHDTNDNLYIFTQPDGTRYEFYDDVQSAHPVAPFTDQCLPAGPRSK